MTQNTQNTHNPSNTTNHATPVGDRVADFNRDGFISPVAVLSPAEAARHRQRLEDAERRLGQSLHYRVKPHTFLTSAAELIRNDALLDAIEALIGPDILAWDSAYIIKEPDSPDHVSWHQDLTYWGLEHERVVTAWIALGPATVQSGCMRMILGSHKNGIHTHRDTFDNDNVLHRGQQVAADIDENRAVPVPLQPGEASLHHGWVMHASAPNRSDDRRIGLSVQFTTPCNRQTVIDGETATLVRGEDRYGHFGTEPLATTDLDPQNMAFQQELEKRKHAVYDAD